MTRHLLPAIVGIALAAGILAAPTSASPLAGLKDVAVADSLVHKTHGCHRSCEWGFGRGWHRHVGPYCQPVWCAPQAKQPFRCWRDRWAKRHCWY